VPPPLDRRPPWVPWSSAIKAPAPGAPELSHRPAATLWPSTAHPSQERRGGRGRRRGSAEAARRRRCHQIRGHRPNQARRRCAALHCTALLLELHGRNPPLRHHPIFHDTKGEPRFSPARRRTSLCRPWRSTLGARRPRPSLASGYTRTHAHIRDHAVTAPPAPRSAPTCLTVATMPPWTSWSPYRPHGDPKPRLESLDALAVPPRIRRSPYPPSRATREPTCATSPPASTAEPPITVAKALGSSGRHFDPTIIVAMAWGSFSPPQLDTSAAVGACR